MNHTERPPKTASLRTGLFAVRANAFRVQASAARRATTAAATLLLTLTGLLCTSGIASAAVVHEFQKPLSEAFSKGVPAGCEGKATACISGPLSNPTAFATTGTDVWIADGGNRVDRFSEAGAFVGPQLDEEGGVSGLGETGTGAAGGLGVGHAFLGEQVYVTAGNEVAVYDGETGKLEAEGVWKGAHTSAGSFSTPPGEGFARLTGMAVDESSEPVTDPAAGDVYAPTRSLGGESAGNVVDVFSPKKAEEEGLKAGEEPVPVTELRGTCPSPGEVVGAPGCEKGAGEIPFRAPQGVAVSPVSGDLLVADGEANECQNELNNSEPLTCVVDVFKPEALGNYSFLFQITGSSPSSPFTDIGAMALDGGAGEIYVYEMETGLVDQFSATGQFEGQIKAPSGFFPQRASSSLDVDPQTHDVFVGNPGATPALDVFGPSITIPGVKVPEPPATPLEVKATSAVLSGTVTPEGGATTCGFEYGTSTSYGTPVACSGPGTATEPIAEGTGEVPVQSKAVEGLQPDTVYFYRLEATNTNGHTNKGECPADCGQFTTSGPGLHGEWSSEVAATSAELNARIEPHRSPTSYYFQYSREGTEGCEKPALPPASAGACVTVPGEAIGSASKDEKVSQTVQGLEPGTRYHYRVVVVSEPQAGVQEAFAEPDHTFATQLARTGFVLPDGRAAELVSPPDKHGALLDNPLDQHEGSAREASVSGDAITYTGTKPTEGAQGYVYEEQILSTRGPHGWESRDISLPHSTLSPQVVGLGQEYRLFSEDLSLAVAEPAGRFTSLKPEVFPPDSERTPYLRHNLTCASEPGTCYRPLLTGCPAPSQPCAQLVQENADVPPGTEFGGSPELERGPVEFAAATPNLEHVILSSGGALSEWSASKPPAEELRPVSVLPLSEGGASVAHADVGNGSSARSAVSDDGSRVVWISNEATHGLYLTYTGGSEPRSVRLDTVQSGNGEGNVEPKFQIANGEGSRIYFSDSQQLVEGAGRGDLYECAVMIAASGEPTCALRDVAPDAAVLGGVLGASQDGSDVYFVSNSVVGNAAAHGATAGDCLTGDEDKSHSCNLYVVRYDTGTGSWEAPVWIATLSGADNPDWSPGDAGQPTRVSPNGQYLAFMSDQSLTGYDNIDLSEAETYETDSGQVDKTGPKTKVHHDEEVFLYHASEAGGSSPGRLICASCDPTGARPEGVAGEARFADVEGWERNRWIAANVPGWTRIEGLENRAGYQSRYLSDEGRLFFNSSDALVPQDVNHQEDVYELEPAGIGTCTEATSTFHAATGGCTSLISSGTSADESAFLDASANGNDVFFVTAEKLVPQDLDTSFDVYDAHVCGAEGVPCTSAPQSASPCETADACRTAAPPQPSIFGSPASATFSGPGNQAPATPVKAETAAEKKARALAKALKLCKKDKRKPKRQACEKQARSKYGPTRKKAKAKKATNDRRAK